MNKDITLHGIYINTLYACMSNFALLRSNKNRVDT